MAASATSSVSRLIWRQMKTGQSSTTSAVAGRGDVDISIGLDSTHPAQSQLDDYGAKQTDHEVSRMDAIVPDARAAQKRAGRFARLVSSASDDAREREVGLESRPAVVEDAPGVRFGNLVDHDRSASARLARTNMAAVKALTPLVASISFYPGNSAEPTLKSSALASLIVKVQQAANGILLAMGPSASNIDWARGQIMQVLANIAAKQWEAVGQVDLEPAVSRMTQLLQSHSEELQSALDSFNGADAYVEARTPDIAKARVLLSVTSAAWDLYEWVTRDSLRLQKQPSRFFSYDRPVDQIIEILMGRVINEARGMQIQVNSVDLQVSHLQGSIRRLVHLAGAEYVTQTNAILAWIEDPGIDSAERERRYQAAVDQFESRVVPRIMEYVHVNFVGIEHRARKLLMDFDPVESRQAERNDLGA